MVKRAGQLRIGLFEGRLQRLSRSLPLLCRRVANGFELTCDRIDAPLVAAASAALISWARACDRAKLSSTLAAKRPSVASNASLRPEISPMSAWRLSAAAFESGVERLLLLREITSDIARASACWASCPASALASDWVEAERRPRAATCDEMPPSACWNSSTRVASPL